jgi:tRNA(adenine34) deaminase
MLNMNDPEYFSLALDAAQKAALRGEVPVGAVLVHAPTNRILSISGNETEAKHDVTAHAEILALRAGGEALGDTRLPECDLYVTLEPCAMCAAAISFARIRRLIFGAYDPKSGGVEHGGRFYRQSTCHHAPEVISGVREAECAALLQQFFSDRR